MEIAVLALLVLAAPLGARFIASRVATARRRDEQKTKLARAERLLEKPTGDVDAGWIAGYLEGFRVTLRLTIAGVSAWTEIDVEMPPLSVAVGIEVRPYPKGAPANVRAGDPFYDTFYLRVEPREAASTLLDSAIRRKLLALGPLHVAQGDRSLRVRQEEWSDSGAHVRDLLEIATAFADKIVAESARRGRAAEATPEVVPLRPTRDYASPSPSPSPSPLPSWSSIST